MIKYIDNQEVIMIKAGHWEVLMQTLIQTFMDRRSDLLTVATLGDFFGRASHCNGDCDSTGDLGRSPTTVGRGVIAIDQCFADHSVAGTIGIADSASRYWHGARGDCASDLRVVANLSKYLFRDLGNRRVN